MERSGTVNFGDIWGGEFRIPAIIGEGSGKGFNFSIVVSFLFNLTAKEFARCSNRKHPQERESLLYLSRLPILTKIFPQSHLIFQ